MPTTVSLNGLYQFPGWIIDKIDLTFLPEGIEENSRATERLKIYVSRLCRFMPVNKTATFFPVSVNTVRRWHKDVLQRTLPTPELGNIHAILIDETSIGKGYNYLTLVLNARVTKSGKGSKL